MATKNNISEGPTPRTTNNNKKKPNGALFGLLAFAIATLIMAAVLGGAFYVVIHNNMGGLADKYRMNIKSIPVLKLALPQPVNPEDDKQMTEDEVREKYRELLKLRDDLRAQLEEKHKAIEQLEKERTEHEGIKAENARIKSDVEAQQKQIDDDRKQFEEDSKAVNGLIANGDKQGFKEYFEKVDKETAERVYGEIVKEEKANEQIRSYAKLYESMDASSAAKIFEEMGSSKSDFVVEILKNMKKEVSAEVLSAMSPSYAAKLADKLRAAYVTIN
ncbi:MgtE-like protein [Anaerobacterium chartisolvens]|uniref:MgtE-like protein n=1 Tax=Anaerobacterium chartisolvens TaxID=1297424 RepID=A0A369B2E6_9FIRM|nr:DUF615 domain-containing protein [Anaerobacterium chartisolvens]RCX15515.1 MgtE-like protein [Anaerobacterium chartisolvens]